MLVSVLLRLLAHSGCLPRHTRSSPMGRRCPRLEALEDRWVPATIRWDGGPLGIGTDWCNPVNWVGDSLPDSADDAEILEAFRVIPITAACNVSVRSIDTDAAVEARGAFNLGVATSTIDNAFTVAETGVLTVPPGTIFTLSSLVGSGSLINRGTVEIGNPSGFGGMTLSLAVDNSGLFVVHNSPGITGHMFGARFTNHDGGTAVFGPGAFVQVQCAVTCLTNHGLISLNQSQINVRTSTVLLNQSGGRIETTGSSTLIANIVNDGTITVNGGQLVIATGIFTGWSVENNGTFHAAGGNVDVQCSTSCPAGSNRFINNGTVQVSPGQTFMIRRSLTNFQNNTLTGGTYLVEGRFAFLNADIVTNVARIELAGTNAAVTNPAGANALARFSDNAPEGRFVVREGSNFSTTTFTNSGTLGVGPDTTFLVTGGLTNFDPASRTLRGGAFEVAGNLVFPDADIVTNAASLVLDGPAANVVSFPTGAAGLRNFAVNAAKGSFTLLNGHEFTAAGGFSNAGTVALAGGTLVASTVDLQGGRLEGTGFIVGDVVNAGRVVVGGDGASGGLSIFGNYTQTDTGHLDIEIGGSTPEAEYDYLYIEGSASLDGTLNLRLLNDYRPQAGDFFAPLTFNGVSGDFAKITGLDLGGGLAFYPFFDDFGYYLWTYE